MKTNQFTIVSRRQRALIRRLITALIPLILAILAASLHAACGRNRPYVNAEPQKSGWPLTEEERAYISRPDVERRPGAEQGKILPALWPVTPAAGYCGGTCWLDAHAKLVADVEANKGPVDILLVGDSLLQQWGGQSEKPFNQAWLQAFGDYKTVNIGLGGDQTQNVLWRLDHGGVAGLEPRLIILLIGHNNLFYVPQTGIAPVAQGIRLCVENLRETFPKAEVLALTVPPARKPGIALYEDIKALNMALDGLKLERDPKVHLLDVGGSFLNSNGTLRAELFIADEIHLTQTAGYSAFAAQLKPAVARLLGTR